MIRRVWEAELRAWNSFPDDGRVYRSNNVPARFTITTEITWPKSAGDRRIAVEIDNVDDALKLAGQLLRWAHLRNITE